MDIIQKSPENNLYTRSIDTKNQILSSKISVLKRLATFQPSDIIQCPKLTRNILASLGFYNTRKDNIIQCQGCQFQTVLSITAEDLVNNHLSQSPQCYFTQKSCNILTINSKQTNKTSESQSTYIQNKTNISSDNNLNPLKIFLESLSFSTLENLRECTFSNWPLITPSASEMIAAGWSYTNISDRVICVHCEALCHKWTDTDQPYQVHQLKSPHCRFIRLSERNSRNNSNRNTPIATEPTTEAAVGVIQSPYSLWSRRHESFNTWPHSDEHPLPTVESFVDAGFYYTGKLTNVRCFYCNGALQNWMKSDDPKVEHARWYPRCDYIRQYIGKNLYEAIQRKNKELKAQQNNSKQAVPWAIAELDRMVKARLDLPSVEKLRDIGFSMAIIRKSFEMQLKFKKDDFKTFNDLYLACLILDLQVRLINGNEANLLVPKDWLEKHIQEQKLELMETEKIENEPISTTQSTTNKQSNENSKICLSCMNNERQVACLPCGHLSSCAACGPSLNICPICRTEVKAFVRIYV